MCAEGCIANFRRIALCCEEVFFFARCGLLADGDAPARFALRSRELNGLPAPWTRVNRGRARDQVGDDCFRHDPKMPRRARDAANGYSTLSYRWDIPTRGMRRGRGERIFLVTDATCRSSSGDRHRLVDYPFRLPRVNLNEAVNATTSAGRQDQR